MEVPDAAVFVSPPFITCPKCGQPRFGVLGIGPHVALRFCLACRFKGGMELPRLNKRIVFLDQSALSKMLHAIAPLPEQAHRKDPYREYWRALFLQLDNLVRMQLIACPFTSVHVEESMLDSRKVQGLDWIARRLAADMHFEDSFAIKLQQIVESAVAWLHGRPIGVSRHTTKFALRGDRTAWLDKLMLRWPIEWPAEVVDIVRSVRDETHHDLAPVHESWKSNKETFEEHCRQEALGYGSAMVDRERRAAVPAEKSALTVIVATFKLCGLEFEPALKKATEFFSSAEALQQVPFLRLSAMLSGVVAHELKHGRKALPNRGSSGDSAAVSTSLPFCDAMFVDNEYARLLRFPPVAKEVERYGCRVFSLQTRDAFTSYLNAIEAAASAEHLAFVEESYGPKLTELPKFTPPKSGCAPS